jgi:hypothetical protein
VECLYLVKHMIYLRTTATNVINFKEVKQQDILRRLNSDTLLKIESLDYRGIGYLLKQVFRYFAKFLLSASCK